MVDQFLVHPREQIDPLSFQRALQGFLLVWKDDYIEALATLYNVEVTQVVDTVTLKHCLCLGGKGHCLHVFHGVKSNESAWTNGAHFRAHSGAVRLVKQTFIIILWPMQYIELPCWCMVNPKLPFPGVIQAYLWCIYKLVSVELARKLTH